jgi:hypothetical protein
MTDSPVTEPSDSEGHQHPTGEESSSPVHFSRAPKTLQWLTYAALALGLTAAVFAGLAYFYPAHTPPSVAQQSGDAKTNVCSAYKAAHRSVVINTHMQSNANDAVGELAVATSARLALIGGGAYLRDRLDANTAAPADLTDAVNSFANTIEQLGINYLTNAGADTQNSLRHDLDSQIAQLDKLCA